MSNSDNIDNQEAVKLEAPDNCQRVQMAKGGAYPRSCQICRLGPCPYSTRTTPAKLDAPDNQEALAGEGVEDKARLDWLNDECADVQFFAIPTGGDDADVGVRIVGHFQGARPERVLGEVYEQDVRKALDVARAAVTEQGIYSDQFRTLPSNEALAGDDRNGVEGQVEPVAWRWRYLPPGDAPQGWIIRTSPIQPRPARNGEGAIEVEPLYTLSRTPSSPQADEADVERVAVVLEEWDMRPPPDACTGHSYRDIARAAIATMTTRPAGGEEVEKAARNSGLIEAALECERQAKEMTFSSEVPEAEQQCARRTASIMATMIRLLLTHDNLGQWHGFEQLAALTKPGALPKEGEEALLLNWYNAQTAVVAAAWAAADDSSDDYDPKTHVAVPNESMEALGEAFDALEALVPPGCGFVGCGALNDDVRTALSSLPVRSGEVERLREALLGVKAYAENRSQLCPSARAVAERARAALAPPPQAQEKGEVGRG